jgi:hypothetical protein
MRRRFHVLLLGALVSATLPAVTLSAAPPRPNIVHILADDLG